MIRRLLILITAIFAVALPAAAQGTKSDKPYFVAKEVYTNSS